MKRKIREVNYSVIEGMLPSAENKKERINAFLIRITEKMNYSEGSCYECGWDDAIRVFKSKIQNHQRNETILESDEKEVKAHNCPILKGECIICGKKF